MAKSARPPAATLGAVRAPAPRPDWPPPAWPPFPYRVAIADDSASARRRVARLLGPGVELVEIAGLADLDRALQSRVDLLITEHALTWGDAVFVTREALARVPTLPVVVVTGRGDEQVVAGVLRAGAAGYLCKSQPDGEIRDALADQLSPWNGPSAGDPSGVPALLDALGVGFLRTAVDGTILDANRVLTRVSGHAGIGALATVNVSRLYHDPTKRAELLASLDSVGMLRCTLFAGAGADGIRRFAEVDARTTRHANGQVLCYEALVHDCTARESRRRELGFQAAVLDQLQDGVIALDADLRVRYWNRHAEALYGWSAAEAQGQHIVDLVVADDGHRLVATIEAALASSECFDVECGDRRKDGSRIVLHKWVTVVRDQAFRRVGTVIVCADLSDLRRQEEALQRALAHREALIREVNHRVKNNLQVVSSLLGLQGRRVADPALAGIVAECQEQVRAIALAHELLYESPCDEGIDVPAYLGRLVTRLAHAHAHHLTVSLGNVVRAAFGVDVSIGLGLIVNDLVRGAAKRAVASAQPAAVTVDLLALGAGRFELAVRDSGTAPLPPMELVEVLARQLRGTLRVEKGDGTHVRLTFTLSCDAPAPDGPGCPDRRGGVRSA